MRSSDKPPFVSERLLSWLLPDEEWQTPLGDFEEYYHEIARERGRVAARWWYRWQVLKLIPIRLRANTFWSVVMLKNYFRVAIRSLRRQRGFAFINVFGLALGIACCLLITLHVVHEVSFDSSWENSDDLYRISITEHTATTESEYNLTPPILAPTLASDYPEVIRSSRLSYRRQLAIRHEGDLYDEKQMFKADSNFFSLFEMSFLEGSSETALAQPSSIVMTESTARKYFGTESAVGKVVEVIASTTNVLPYTVTAVVADPPVNSHLQFDMLWSWWRTGQERNEPTGWLGYGVYTYMQLRPGFPEAEIEAKFPAMLSRYAGEQLSNAGRNWEEHLAAGNQYIYDAMPVRDIHLTSHTNWELSPPGDARAVFLFSGVALFILLVACVNYMNLSTARSETRAKEIGMRKVLGSRRKQLVMQMLSESALMTFLAFATAIILVVVSAPMFQSLTGTTLFLEYLQSTPLILGMIGLVIGISLLAGSYPALVMSAIPSGMLTKSATSGNNGGVLFRNSLVVFQFVVSILLLSGTFVVNDQIDYLLNKDLGFDRDATIIVERAGIFRDNRPTFTNRLKALSSVEEVSFASSLPSTSHSELFMAPGPAADVVQHNVYVTFADHDFVDALGLELDTGRVFQADRSSDSMAVMVNQALLVTMGIEGDPIGQELKFTGNDEKYPIVGVLKDFHFQSLHTSINPFAYFIEDSAMGKIAVRINTSSISNALEEIETVWNEFAPSNLFQYSFLDETVREMYAAENQSKSLLSVFSMLALVIACLGLFGLSAFTVARRTKEIGVRKIFGASESGIIAMLNKEFARTTIIALVIAVPLAFFGMSLWLENFAYRTEIGVMEFVFSGGIVMLISVLTVSIQARRAARSKPIDALRYE